MAGYKLTGLGAGTSSGDSLRYEQVVGVFLPLAGGTMAGNIAMGGSKLTGLGAGTSSGDSLRYEQVVGVFLPLAGGTMSGDIVLGAYKLKTTNLLLRENDPNWMYIRNINDTDYKNFGANAFFLRDFLSLMLSTNYIVGPGTDGGYWYISARKSGVGYAEVARFQGAANPYFQMTLPPVLYPATLPGTPVEGHFLYSSERDKLVYRNASAWRTIWGNYTKASANVRNSNDATKDTASATYVKLKEILLNEDIPACRVSFRMTVDAGDTGYAKIYKNDVAIGTERGGAGAINTTYTEDFTGFVSGDKIQLYAKRTAGSGTVAVTEMRLCYDVDLEPASVTNQDPA
jgi:hypothetical protein